MWEKQWFCDQASWIAPCYPHQDLKLRTVPFVSSVISVFQWELYNYGSYPAGVYDGVQLQHHQATGTLAPTEWKCVFGGREGSGRGFELINVQGLFRIYWCVAKCVAAFPTRKAVYVLIFPKSFQYCGLFVREVWAVESWPQNRCN